MKINDELLKYIAGDLDPSERRKVEEKISNDPDLQSELELYRKKFAGLKNLADIEPDSAYFNNLLPKVNEKIEKRSKHVYNWKIAYALPVIIVLGFIIYNRFLIKPVSTKNDIHSIIAQMDDSSKAELLSEDYDQYDISDSVTAGKSNQALTEELSKEILKSNKTVTLEEALPLDTHDLINDMSKEEAEIVYRDLINKKIM